MEIQGKIIELEKLWIEMETHDDGSLIRGMVDADSKANVYAADVLALVDVALNGGNVDMAGLGEAFYNHLEFIEEGNNIYEDIAKLYVEVERLLSELEAATSQDEMYEVLLREQYLLRERLSQPSEEAEEMENESETGNDESTEDDAKKNS